MDRSFDELEAIVRNRICGVCTERTNEAECGLENPSSCALFRLFPRVVQAIQSVDSNNIQEYVDAIRRDVCSACEEQSHDGSCESRLQVQCGLDAYLLLVVNAIEEATGKTFDRSNLEKTGLSTLPAGPAVHPDPQIRL